MPHLNIARLTDLERPLLNKFYRQHGSPMRASGDQQSKSRRSHQSSRHSHEHSSFCFVDFIRSSARKKSIACDVVSLKF